MTVLLGVVIVANGALLFAAYSLTSIAAATVVYHTQPFFLLLINTVVLREPVPGGKIGWIAVAFPGVMLLTGVDPASLSLTSGYTVGLLLALCAAAPYAIATLIAKRLKGVRPHLIALSQVSVGIVLLAPRFDALEAIETIQWGYLLILGGVHTGLMYVVLYSAVGKLPIPTIAVMGFIYPIVAIAADDICYDHALNAAQFAGVAMILFAGFAVNRNLSLIPTRFRGSSS